MAPHRIPLAATFRHIAAVVAGYIVFAALTAALFAVTGRDPHRWHGWLFLAGTTVAGSVAALLAGYVAGVVGGGRPHAHARTVALCVAAVAIVSWLARPGGGAVWTQAVAVCVLAPMVLVGGYLRSWQVRAE